MFLLNLSNYFYFYLTIKIFYFDKRLIYFFIQINNETVNNF